MPTFNENNVNRDDKSKQFADKPQSAPETKIAPARKPNTLGGYEIKAYKSHGAGMEGGGFTANVYLNGKKVLIASNDGNGGSHRYSEVMSPTLREKINAGTATYPNEEAKFLAKSQVGCPDIAGDLAADEFLELVILNADIDKHAAKYSQPRELVIDNFLADTEQSIKDRGYEATDWEIAMNLRQAEILRNPELLDSE